jgi:hypothetical protein
LHAQHGAQKLLGQRKLVQAGAVLAFKQPPGEPPFRGMMGNAGNGLAALGDGQLDMGGDGAAKGVTGVEGLDIGLSGGSLGDEVDLDDRAGKYQSGAGRLKKS